MGQWLARCTDCDEPIRMVLRPGKWWHRIEDAVSGKPHLCAARLPVSVEWFPCACGAVIQRVGGVSQFLNRDCTPHVHAAPLPPERPAVKIVRIEKERANGHYLGALPPGVIER